MTLAKFLNLFLFHCFYLCNGWWIFSPSIISGSIWLGLSFAVPPTAGPHSFAGVLYWLDFSDNWTVLTFFHNKGWTWVLWRCADWFNCFTLQLIIQLTAWGKYPHSASATCNVDIILGSVWDTLGPVWETLFFSWRLNITSGSLDLWAFLSILSHPFSLESLPYSVLLEPLLIFWIHDKFTFVGISGCYVSKILWGGHLEDLLWMLLRSHSRPFSSSCPRLASSLGEPSSNDSLTQLSTFSPNLLWLWRTPQVQSFLELAGLSSMIHPAQLLPRLIFLFSSLLVLGSWPQERPLINLPYANLHLRVCFLESPTCDKRDVNTSVHSAIWNAFYMLFTWLILRSGDF